MKIFRFFNDKVRYTRNKSQLKNLSVQEVAQVSIVHRLEVQSLGLKFLTEKCLPDLISHDFTKIDNLEDFIKAKNTEGNFKNEKWWYQHHMDNEPHHALEYHGTEKINLWHFMHMAFDWVLASKTRSKDGKFGYQVNPEKFAPQLVKAFRQLILDLDEMTEVVDFDQLVKNVEKSTSVENDISSDKKK